MSKKNMLRVRMTSEELSELDQLAAVYKMGRSDFVRHIIKFVDEHRPDVKVTFAPEGKEWTLVGVTA